MSFKTYHPGFESILGHAPSIDLLLEKTYPFAHEAGIYIPETSELFITSNRLVDDSGIQRVEISKIKLGDSVADTKCDEVRCGDVAMANGGVNYGDRILFCAQGSQTQPSGLYITTTTEPYLTEALTTSFYDRPFNSVNDVVVHSDGSVWFTDPTYGHEQGYRPPPSLPPQVYRFSPRDGSIRAMADGFGHPNGICFSPNEKTLYVTDTDWIWGDGSTSDTRVSSIYAFDLTGPSEHHFLTNRRLFAMCDTGTPDGIKCDMQGNVYSGCGDGVNVWSCGGLLLGKILLDGGVANFCFGRPGELYLLNETRLWRVKIASSVRGALLGL